MPEQKDTLACTAWAFPLLVLSGCALTFAALLTRNADLLVLGLALLAIVVLGAGAVAVMDRLADSREIPRAAESWREYLVSRLGESEADEAVAELSEELWMQRRWFVHREDSWHNWAGWAAGNVVISRFWDSHRDDRVLPSSGRITALRPTPDDEARAWSAFTGYAEGGLDV